MKRLLQFVALFVVVLLAAQPALASLPCAQGASANGACAPGCTMALTSAPMSQMTSDCGMSPQLSSNGCEQSCCATSSIQGASQPATGTKSKVSCAVQFVTAPLLVANGASAFAPPPPVDPVSSAPAKYILFQIFRI